MNPTEENHHDPVVESPPLDHIFSYWARVSRPEVVGPLPEGIRAHVYVQEGQITGPRLRGRLLPVGGDWLLFRTDGMGLVDVRATFEAEDGSLIYTTGTGIIDFGADGYDKFLNGQLPPRLVVKMAPRFHTAAPQHQWLNRLQCIGIGDVDSATMVVSHNVFAIR